MTMRKNLGKARLIVVKIGTSTLTTPEGRVDHANLNRLAGEIAALYNEGRKIILVSSGAIAMGAERLDRVGKLKSIPEKQAAAAVGQGLLMKEYEAAFSRFKIPVAQLLLTRDAMENRERYINARTALETLVDMGTLPIINENDTVAVEEIKVGDNDNLAALVASLIGADLLVLLTDIDGFHLNPEDSEEPLSEIDEITSEIRSAAAGSGSALGTGGMVTKLEAAELCMAAGIAVVIGSGRRPGTLEAILKGEETGTLFVPALTKREAQKRWLAHGMRPKGKIVVDAGAAKAIREKGSSLLAVGVKEVKGRFERGDLVSLLKESGKEIARGLVNYGSSDIAEIKGARTADIEKRLGYKYADEIIHRDELAVLESE